ncbi:hypothetical protein KJ807_05640 [Patescibacteria group bacterium]|nr:hypothetical protein [Patescibacteria group bacterium]
MDEGSSAPKVKIEAVPTSLVMEAAPSIRSRRRAIVSQPVELIDEEPPASVECENTDEESDWIESVDKFAVFSGLAFVSVGAFLLVKEFFKIGL